VAVVRDELDGRAWTPPASVGVARAPLSAPLDMQTNIARPASPVAELAMRAHRGPVSLTLSFRAVSAPRAP